MRSEPGGSYIQAMKSVPHVCTLAFLAFAAALAGGEVFPAAEPQRAANPQRGGAPRGGGGPTLTVQVTDKSGNPIAGTEVAVAGPVERTGTTGQDGSIVFRTMRAGTYRLRFEREGFITLERELAIRGESADVLASLSPAPAAKTAPAPAPPAPAPVAGPTPPKRAIEPRVISVTDYFERNYIKSEPQKVSLLTCMDSGTARLLQVREPMTNEQHNDADELIYIVAGSGSIHIRGQEHQVEAGWFAVVPRGAPHTIRRAGRNPLFALTVLSGAPCHDTAAPVR